MFSITLTSYYLNDCCLYFSHRISEVCAVLSRPRCAAKHPPERGSESRRARGHNTPKFSLSTKQGDFNLHSKLVFTSVLPHTCYIVVIAFLLFKCCLWNNFFFLQAQRVPVRKNRPEATAVPASKTQHCSTRYLYKTQSTLISLSF